MDIIMFLMIEVQAYIPPEDGTETGSRHVMGRNKTLLILNICVEVITGVIRVFIIPVLSFPLSAQLSVAVL
jgi:hypothetical protein